jgi:uncharacterized protein YcfJ
MHTAVKETAAGLPLDFAGMALGGIIGKEFGLKPFAAFGHSHDIGSMAGAAAGGLAANYAVLKHERQGQQT